MLRSGAPRLRVLSALLKEAHPPARNLRPALRSFSSEKDPTPLRPSWSKDFRLLFHRFMKKCNDGSWTLISDQDVFDFQYRAYRSFQNSELIKDREASLSLVLTRNFPEGLGFEYAIFHNKDEQRMVCVFQGGPFLQGWPGLLHGGASATMIDSTISLLAMSTVGITMTATLNITYKRPISIGSVVVITCQVDKIENRKVFLSCSVRSADEKTLYSEATNLGKLLSSASGGGNGSSSSHGLSVYVYSWILKKVGHKRASGKFHIALHEVFLARESHGPSREE